MSHINPLSTFKPYEPLGKGFRLFWSRVVDNTDERLLGRIKCQIENLLPWDDTEKLPWIYPLYPAGLGQGPLSSHHCVPEKDSYVMTIFPLGSIYHGFYVWHTTDKLRRMTDFHSEYPQRYGWQDSKENKLIVNKDEDVNAVELRFADGTLFVHDSKDSTTTYSDQFGTHLHLDRKNQKGVVNFAGGTFSISEDGIEVSHENIVLIGRKKVVIDDG